MNRKNIIKTVLVGILAFILYQVVSFFIPQGTNLQSIYLIPKDAVFIMETDQPIDSWETVSKSKVWKHLQNNAYFKELTSSLNSLDAVFNQKKSLFDFIGNRDLYISVHMISKKKYGLFFTIDLQKFSKLNILKNHLETFTSSNFKVTKRKYHGFVINEIYDKKTHETLNLTFINNQMLASYTHKLVEASIDQHQEPFIGRDLDFIEVTKKVAGSDLFRLYIQYKYLDDYTYYFTNQPSSTIVKMSEALKYSGFSFDLKNKNTIYAKGYTNTSETTENYLKALQNSGKGPHKIANIAPARTAIYLSLGFESFKEFYTNFENIQKENPEKFKVYQDNLDKTENFLNISIKENFADWMGNEIAILHMDTSLSSLQKTETALVIKANSIDDAKTNLDFVLKQIKRKTPVKFKKISYKNHDINYLSIKGFFKVFLGSYFKEFDKPYFTYIDDYVVFSNYPNTLKSIIDDYEEGNVLAKSDDYKHFNKNFDSKSSLFTYINTPTLYKNLVRLADKNTKTKILKNKDYIICFPQIGFQLTPYGNLFETTFVIDYQDPDTVNNKEQFKEVTVRQKPNKTEENKTEINIITINKSDLFQPVKIVLKDLDTDSYLKKYANGKTHISVKIKDGLPNGRYKEYYPNGELKLSGKFKDGKQTGMWKAYTANGKLMDKKRF